MDVSDLLDIKAICDAGSYRKAAETLGVTQPTLSNRIAYPRASSAPGSSIASTGDHARPNSPH
ncbi:MAG: LysR family transcriptional regulator [Proteobacteria bacterium]|nr:LysR family transcriptional regulator [Pseudomonadota bacterium]